MTDTRPCSEKCWTPVRCKAHGQEMAPAGRSVPMGGYYHECPEVTTRENTMHLWGEHDGDREFFDPKGWADHYATCEYCNHNLEDDES